MENKKDIGEVFKERFANYASTPDPKIWKGIDANGQKSFGIKEVFTWSAAVLGVAAIIVGIVYFVSSPNAKDVEQTIPQTQQNNIVPQKEPAQTATITDTTPNKKHSGELSLEERYSLSYMLQKKYEQDSTAHKHQPKTAPVKIDSTKFKKPDTSKKDTTLSKVKTKPEHVAVTEPISNTGNTQVENRPLPEITHTQANPTPKVKTEELKPRENPTPVSTPEPNKPLPRTEQPTQVASKAKEEVFMPNAFTPNGSTNNEFKAKGENVAQFEMAIYTRKGECIFQTKDINHGWDGRIKGADAPKGAYMYAVKYKTKSGTMHQQNGTVNLLKD